MTLPNERTRAVLEMERAILNLLPHLRGKGEVAMVPRETLRDIWRLLRHYPTPHDMKITAEKCPELWG